MQFKKKRELKRTRIEIIPMIDTMFFLLVFFMLSSLALTRLTGLPVNLPKAATAPKRPAADLTVTIDRDEHVFIGTEPVSLENLGARLLAKAGGANADLANASVVISADTTVQHGLVVRCIDTARSVGITKFAIATNPENGGDASPSP